MAPERFFFHPSASAELREATKWYRDRAPDIAADFLNAIYAAVANIVSAPQRWPLKGRWRRYYLRRFPYVIAYREVDELLQIGAVAHQRRLPDYWSRRR